MYENASNAVFSSYTASEREIIKICEERTNG